MKDLRIAAVICQSQLGQVQNNLNRSIQWVHAAKKKGAHLICFPELNLTGYCTRYNQIPPAFPLNDPVITTLQQVADSQDIIILAGLVESGGVGRPYISHLVVAPGRPLGVYRKLHLAPPEQKLFNPGQKIEVFRFDEMTFGIQLCYDAHFPELSARMVELGAEIIFFPHASPRGNAQEKHASWMRHLPARAFDNSIFVVACNQVGDNCNQLVFPGNALAIGPSGELLDKAVRGEEELLLVDLKGGVLEAVRSHPMRHFFPNRRTDLYLMASYEDQK